VITAGVATATFPRFQASSLSLAVAYLLIPVDLVSDFIPGLGQLDDAAFLLACLYFLEKDLSR